MRSDPFGRPNQRRVMVDSSPSIACRRTFPASAVSLSQTPLSAPAGSPNDSAFDPGTVFDFHEHHPLIFPAGCSVDGPVEFEMYIAYQYTSGPELFHHQPAPSRLESVNR